MATGKGDWAKPKKVTGADVAFGGSMKELLPPMDVIPRSIREERDPAYYLALRWFYEGLIGARLIPREGIDKGEALAHIKAVMGSFEPQHEHKMAGCAYLLSLFFKEMEAPSEASSERVRET